MSNGGKVAWGLVKWLVIPCALAYVGYAFYGPMIGKEPPKQLAQVAEQVTGVPMKKAEPTEEEAKPAEEFTAPTVEVNVLSRDGRKLKEPTVLEDPGSSL